MAAGKVISPKLSILAVVFCYWLPATSCRKHHHLTMALASRRQLIWLLQVLPCTKRYCHDWLACAFTHPGEAMCRRDPTRFAYTGIACPDKKVSHGWPDSQLNSTCTLKSGRTYRMESAREARAAPIRTTHLSTGYIPQGFS